MFFERLDVVGVSIVDLVLQQLQDFFFSHRATEQIALHGVTPHCHTLLALIVSLHSFYNDMHPWK